MLSIIGNLTLLFSESNCPYLPYKCHKNIFYKYKYLKRKILQYLTAQQMQKKGNIGICLKTWMGQSNQKVTEFGRLKETKSD